MRGIWFHHYRGFHWLGIIPAGAGHLPSAFASSCAISDHPRRCGAFLRIRALPSRPSGSSPQVRGILGTHQRRRDLAGIIPAGAGHFPLALNCGISSGDHPRRCGAFPPKPLQTPLILGSSPQVRGFFCLSLSFSVAGDHPRRCGAFCHRPGDSHKSWGSSPQVRGFSISAPARISPSGIIPAGAGLLLAELEYRSKIFLSNTIL